jgi:NAD(P)-dependent dehydrogenase (short-subunit alcohol dehydrogenase family)
LITGCSSGLGHALAAAAAQAGDLVAVTARSTDSLAPLVEAWPGNVVALPLELRDAHQCADVVAAAEARLGGIDVLVNNAGVGLFGAVEEVGDDELRDQLEMLVVGPWRLTRLVLPGMRSRGSGHIVNVSTVATRAAVPGVAAYLSGKQALEAMSEALAAETAPFGIRVTVVEPGPFATNYGTAMTQTSNTLPDYAAVAGNLGMFRGLAHYPLAGRPEEFARAVLHLLDAPAPMPLRVPVGPGAADMVAGALQAAQEELDAARSLTAAATAHVSGEGVAA